MAPREKRAPLTVDALSRRLEGRVVAGLDETGSGALALRFQDGERLVIERGDAGMSLVLEGRERTVGKERAWPTRRQQEYLEFIRTYMHRTGVSPAEIDIQTHFMVSAPSVNQMVRTLERRGFITRARDWNGDTVPRSIRVLWDG